MSHSAHEQPASESCPYCGQEITHDELLRIEERIENEQQARFTEHAKQLNAKHMDAMSELRKQLAAKDDALKSQLAAKDDLLKAQLAAANDAHAKELKARDRAARAAEETARKAEREKVEKEQQAAAKKVDGDRKALQQERKKFEDEREQQKLEHQRQLDKQREVLNADHEKKMLTEKAAAEKQNFKLQQQLDDMKRRLEKKSNDELADGAEIDLYNDLKRAFPDDVIDRVKKGVAGADVKHFVHSDGRCCGKIVYDSKNRSDWKAKYVEQLRKDQLSEKADHAILATRKFPSGEKELTTRDGIWLVNPGRAVALATLMREAIVQVSSVKLSEEDKNEKLKKLYDFVTSTRCANQFQRFSDEVEHLREIDEREKTQQVKNRRDRAKHVGEMEKTVLGELKREIHDILGV